MFDAYEIDQGQFQDVNVRFRVRFAALMECLAVFGTTSLSTTSVSLSYSQEVGTYSVLSCLSLILCRTVSCHCFWKSMAF